MTTLDTAPPANVGDPTADARARIASRPALQQPDWKDEEARDRSMAGLEASAPLVCEEEVWGLRARLADVVHGKAVVLQAGDCAEPITDTTAAIVEAKRSALVSMADALRTRSGRPVVRIGRIGGQFAKPRSRSHETVAGASLPTYRGALVNDPYPSARARRHEPERLLRAHAAAGAILAHIRADPERLMWASHEALVLDYELPQLRTTSSGEVMLSSAHTIWLGARTNQLDHAHVELASRIINPVGCKISGSTTEDDIRGLADRIASNRPAGKLMLIARMGAEVHRLPSLMQALRQEGHRPIWLSDPMHGNTVTAPDGRKVRYLDAMTRELLEFQEAATAEGVCAGGVHLETTIDMVRECLRDPEDHRGGQDPYTSMCDPRLTVDQALELLGHWTIEG